MGSGKRPEAKHRQRQEGEKEILSERDGERERPREGRVLGSSNAPAVARVSHVGVHASRG